LNFLARSTIERVLSADTLHRQEGLEIQDVRCRHGRGRGDVELHDGRHALVLVRRGCFSRHADGASATLDPTLAYCINPGAEHRYDHAHGDGDDCTAMFFDEELIASVWGGEPRLPTAPIPTASELDIEHRTLLADAKASKGTTDVSDRAIDLTAALLEQVDEHRVASARPATARARKALVDDVREAMNIVPELSLVELSRLLAVSPHHLSRVFRAGTGHTIAAHRKRLRARVALERLAGGEHDLARLAADTGFADQSHLTRVLRDETGRTPSALRAALAASPPSVWRRAPPQARAQ
jgi:AraC-like DNA-binding protein